MQNYIKIVRAVFEIWSKNIKNTLKRGFFPHFRPPKIFFQKSGSVTFVPLWCTNFMQKIRKILRAVSEIFNNGPWTDGRTADIGDYIGPLWINQGPKLLDSRGVKAVPAILSSYIYLLMSCWIKCRSMQNQQNPANVSNVGSHGNCHLFWPLTLINFHEPIQSAKRINNCKTRQ